LSHYLSNFVGRINVKHRRRKPKKRHPWTPDEVKWLVEGVEKFGLGQWAVILQNYAFPPYRSSVSLKDKWRNMKKNKEIPHQFM